MLFLDVESQLNFFSIYLFLFLNENKGYAVRSLVINSKQLHYIWFLFLSPKNCLNFFLHLKLNQFMSFYDIKTNL
jgi:hypothetical protein